MAKKSELPDRKRTRQRSWQVANACAGDGVQLAFLSEQDRADLGHLELDALTEFKRGANGVVELKFTDRAKLLERLLDAVDQSGEEQVERFLQAMEDQSG